MSAGLLAQISEATHTWFWFLGALFIVGIFLAVGGVLRTTLSVIDRSSKLIAATGVVLLVGGLAGSLAVAAGAPGSMAAAMKDMVGLGTVSPAALPSPKPGALAMRVTAKDFSFSPGTISVPAGSKVEVQFVNQGPSFHTFTVPGLGIDLKANGGQRDSVVLSKLEPGRYPFLCTVPGHAQLGMTGTLVVGTG
jgi:plastocyanin